MTVIPYFRFSRKIINDQSSITCRLSSRDDFGTNSDKKWNFKKMWRSNESETNNDQTIQQCVSWSNDDKYDFK